LVPKLKIIAKIIRATNISKKATEKEGLTKFASFGNGAHYSTHSKGERKKCLSECS